MPRRPTVFEFPQAREAVSRYEKGAIASVNAEDAQPKYVPVPENNTVESGRILVLWRWGKADKTKRAKRRHNYARSGGDTEPRRV